MFEWLTYHKCLLLPAHWWPYRNFNTLWWYNRNESLTHSLCILVCRGTTSIAADCRVNTVKNTIHPHSLVTQGHSHSHTLSRLLHPTVKSYIYSAKVLSWNSRRTAAVEREIHRWLPLSTAALINVCVCRAAVCQSGGWVCVCVLWGAWQVITQRWSLSFPRNVAAIFVASCVPPPSSILSIVPPSVLQIQTCHPSLFLPHFCLTLFPPLSSLH